MDSRLLPPSFVTESLQTSSYVNYFLTFTIVFFTSNYPHPVDNSVNNSILAVFLVHNLSKVCALTKKVFMIFLIN